MTNQPTLAQANAHVPQLVLSQDVHQQVHGDNAIGRFNGRIAVRVTKIVGSMWCAYAFALLAFVSLPVVINSHDPIIIVSWIAQTFLQLVLLPIIIVGQNVQSAASDKRAEGDHKTLLAIHTLTREVHNINERQITMLQFLEDRSGGQIASVLPKP